MTVSSQVGQDPRLLTLLLEALQSAREAEQLAEQPRIPGVVERRHVVRGDHEQVRGRLGVQVPEREQAVAALHDRGRDLARGDLAEDATGHQPLPNACLSCSQNFFAARSSGAPSTSASCSSRARCSAVSLVGVHTCTRTCRSPRPPSPTRGRPLPRSRYTVAVCVPGWTLSAASPYGVGTRTSAPSAAWANDSGRSTTRSSPWRSKRGSSAMSSTAIRSPGGPLRGPGTPWPRIVR